MFKAIPNRALALVAGAALALSAAGCGGSEQPEPSTGGGDSSAEVKKGSTVKLWIMPNGPQPQQDMERTLKPFTEETGVKVDVEVVGWDVQLDRIRNAAVTGEGPDVTQAGTTQVPFFAALGGFENVQDRVDAIGGEEAYPEGVWKTTQVTGQDGVWSVPWFSEARALYYRKDVLKKAGVDPETAFEDWDAMRTTLETIKEKAPEMGGKEVAPFGSPGKKAFDLVHHVMPFVWDAGGAELDDSAKKSTINTSEAKQGVEYMAGLLRDGLYDPSQLERDGTQVENQFKAGRLAVYIGGPWTLASASRKDDTNWDDTVRKNVGIAPMPAGPSGEAYTFVGGSNLMMLKDSQVKNEAWALMEFLSKDEVQTKYASRLGMFPSRTAPQRELGERDENQQAFYEAIQQGRTYATIPQWGQIENAYKGRFGNILDSAGGRAASEYSPDFVDKQLDAAAKEADGLLAQSAS